MPDGVKRPDFVLSLFLVEVLTLHLSNLLCSPQSSKHVMSIIIDWDHLTTGTDGIVLAESIRDFIHDKFQQVELPRFIRSVQVHSFDFGKECPVVELKDISDPLPEFYEHGDSDGDGDGDEEEEFDDVETLDPAPPTMRRPSHSTISTTTAAAAAKATQPTFIDTARAQNLRSNLGLTDQITTPFLSRSNTPGIPGGTSNLSYFHLPLSAGLPAAPTPLSAPWADQHHRNTSPVRPHQPHHTNDHNSLSNSVPTFPPATHSHAPTIPEDRTQDLQTTLHITYRGSLSLSLTVEILLDYPMPSFVGIPLKLQITGLSFDGVALLAYLRGSGKRSGRTQFCFLGGEDARVILADEDEDGAAEGKGGLLREMRVESEIGGRDGGRQVLKNVGKVEKFVLERVRGIFEEELVWPSFWTFLV